MKAALNLPGADGPELPARDFAKSFYAWLDSRNYLRLLASVPTLVALVAMGVGAGFLVRWNYGRAEATCLQAASQALQRGNYSQAKFAYDTLLQISQGNRSDYAFRSAWCLSQLGRTNEALAQIEQLAANPERAHAPAALWLAQRQLSMQPLTETNLRSAQLYLTMVQRVEPENLQAAFLLGRIHAQFREWPDARPQLLKAAGSHPEALILLAQLSRATGDEAGCRGWADRALKTAQGRLAQASGDDPSARADMANAEILLGRHEAAVAELEAGLVMTGNTNYTPLIWSACLDWAAGLGPVKVEQLDAWIRLLDTGLTAKPEDPYLQSRLQDFVQLGKDEGTRVGATLRRKLASGQQLPFLNLSLGLMALARNDTALADHHLGSALQLSPGISRLLHHQTLILALRKQPPPDLATALVLSETLTRNFPDSLDYRFTHARVLAASGKLPEAAKELDALRPKLGNTPSLLRQLAGAYRLVGRTNVADEVEASLPAAKPDP